MIQAMSILTRKQRELKLRENAILEAARVLLLESGYHGLTMDRIAEAIEYSKATIYQHFHCKEEVIGALVKGFLDEQLEMQERAAEFKGCPRERMTAIGEAVELFMRLHPDEVHLLLIVQTETIMSKASAELNAAMQGIDFRRLKLMAGIVREAIACGDLVLPLGVQPEELPFTLLSIMLGGHATMLRKLPFNEININDPLATLMRSCQVLGDGYGWRPLSTEWDYEETRRRVGREIFPVEAARAYRS